MRLALAVVTAVVTLALPARAEIEHARPTHDAHDDFWRTVIDPHADEVVALVVRCRAALRAADGSKGQDLDATALDNRDRLYREVTAILVYARKLSPSNVEVLELLGQAADEAGQPRLALDALHAALRVPRETRPREDRESQRDDRSSQTRMAGIYLRLGQLDDAIYWARTAVTDVLLRNTNEHDHALVYLSTAVALRGDMPAAIDVLQLRARDQASFATLALVVQLDRDEQRGAATDTLERMRNLNSDNFAEQLLDDVAHFRFAPPEDEHYYRAMVDEALDAVIEARAEWLTYASFETPYRRRALDHVAALDAARRARPASPHTQIVPLMPPPPSIHRRIHP